MAQQRVIDFPGRGLIIGSFRTYNMLVLKDFGMLTRAAVATI